MPPPASPRGSGRPEGVWWRHRGRIAEKSSPNASSRWPKCTSARASRAGAEEARRDTMPGGGDALAAVHSGQSQAAAGQHDGSALLQPGLTCTGRTETLLTIVWRSSPNLGELRPPPQLATSTQRQNVDCMEVEAGREEEAAVRAGSWLVRAD